MTDQEIKNYIQSLIASTLGKRIDQLPQGDLQPGDFLVFRDMVSGVTRRLPAEQVLTSSTTSGDFRWLSDEPYTTGMFVTYGGKWYEAQEDNTGVVPGSDPTVWLEGSKVYGTFREWQPGLYVNPEEYVVAYDEDDHLFSWRLKDSVPRPFNSSDFLAEVTADKWEAIAKVGSVGSVETRHKIFGFNSNLFTEDEHFFRGLISSLGISISNELTVVTYESRLDTSSTWTASLTLSALQTWINSNVSGTESAGTKFWIRVLATYGVGNTGKAEALFNSTPS